MTNVTVVFSTYAPDDERGVLRREANRKTLQSWQAHLHHAGGRINLHVADDGSTLPGWPPTRPQEPTPEPLNWGLGEVCGSWQWRQGVGASLNAGLRCAFDGGDVALYAADDWALTGDIDLAPWMALLESDPSVGCVRLGPPHPWLTGTIEAFPQGWGMRLDRHHFAFATRPALIHERWIDTYGWFDEGQDAYETERLMNDRFIALPGPDVVLALPHPWLHVGDDAEMAGIVPDGVTA